MKRHMWRWVALGVGVVLVAFAVLLASQVHSDPSFEDGCSDSFYDDSSSDARSESEAWS